MTAKTFFACTLFLSGFAFGGFIYCLMDGSYEGVFLNLLIAVIAMAHALRRNHEVTDAITTSPTLER